MKVLLVEPPSGLDILDRFFLHEPLGLEYLGTALIAGGHEAEILDMRFDTDLEAACTRLRPDVVGLTAYTVQAKMVREISRRLKTAHPSLRIVLGGHHATVQPEDFDVPFIDAVVVGEGVGPLRELVDSWAQGNERPVLAGVALHGRHSAFIPRPHPALDTLPVPDRSLTAQYRDRYFCQWMKPLATVRTSLGCVSRCSFCALWSVTGGRYLRRSAEAVVEELKGIDEPNVFFCDDEAMCDVRRMHELGGKIRSAGIAKKYFLQARVDTVVEHPDLFALWREIGLDQVFLGIETFSDEQLRRMGKGITVEQQRRAVEILHGLGIVAFGSFMVDPAATREDFRRLSAHVARLGIRHGSFSVMTPLPGTEMYETQKELLTTRDTDLFDLTHAVLPTSLPLEEFYSEYRKLFLSGIPLHRRLRVLARYGPWGAFRELRRLRGVFSRLARGYLDHS